MSGCLQQITSATSAQSRRRLRFGSSYIEVQVAMVMLAIGMGGLYSMIVVQTRQGNRLREMLPATQVAAINQAETAWARKLGVYASIDETVNAADVVLPDTSFQLVVDNQDSAASVTFFQSPDDPNGWTQWTQSQAYLGHCRFHRSNGNVGSWAQFNATGLPAGEYEILTTYPSFGTLGTAVPHEIYDGTKLIDTVPVDQTQPTSQVSHQGRLFDSIGVFTVTSGDVHLRLLDGPGSESFMLFDAILIRSRRPLDVVSLQPTANGGAQVVVEDPSL